MSELTQSRETYLKNHAIHFVAKEISILWFGMGDSRWSGDFTEGYRFWGDGEGNEFVTIWNSNILLSAACILECSRFPAGDDGWDEEKSPLGKTRGLQYLNSPPDEVQQLYRQALHLLSNEFVTDGLWSCDNSIRLPEPSEEEDEDEVFGLGYFGDFLIEPEKFLTTKADAYSPSLSELFSLTGELEPLTNLAFKLGKSAFKGLYKLTPEEKKLFTVEINLEYGSVKSPANWMEHLNNQLKKIGLQVE